MANRANTSIAHVLRRALARKFFGALCGTHVLERYDELIAPLSVDMYELKYTGVGACVVRAYRFSDGSVLEVHCAGMGVASLHDYDPVGLRPVRVLGHINHILLCRPAGAKAQSGCDQV